MNPGELVDSLKASMTWLEVNGIEAPLPLLIRAAKAIKTVNYYTRVLRRLVTDLYSGAITQDNFIDMQATLIEQQFRRAWNEGMRANGLDPLTDSTPEYEKTFQNVVAEQFQYVDNFARAIIEARQNETGRQELYKRVDMWANRYDQVVSYSKLVTAEDHQLYVWEYGDTIEHCESCKEQSGKVRTAAEWQRLHEAGIYPGSHDLKCKGYQCKCKIRKAPRQIVAAGKPVI